MLGPTTPLRVTGVQRAPTSPTLLVSLNRPATPEEAAGVHGTLRRHVNGEGSEAAPTAAELLDQLVALQKAANGIAALQVGDRNYIALMTAYRRERDATELLVERTQAAHGLPRVGSFAHRPFAVTTLSGDR